MALTSIAKNLTALKGWNSAIGHVQKLGTTRVNIQTSNPLEALTNIQFLDTPSRLSAALQDPVTELAHQESTICSPHCFVHRYCELVIVKPKIIEIHHYRTTGNQTDPHLFTILPVDVRVAYLIRLLFPIFVEAKSAKVVGRATILENRVKVIANFVELVKGIERLDHFPGIGSLYK